MRKIVLLISILLLCWLKGQAFEFDRDSTQIQMSNDSVLMTNDSVLMTNDSVLMVNQVLKKPHSPHRATIMAMILPGSGQFYNDQWWKVPILYGGIAADVYGILWNQKQYVLYRDSYIEWTQYTEALAINPDTPYPTNPAWDDIRKSFDPKDFETEREKTWFKTTLNNRKTGFKRNRDLCYILIAAIYAINVIDATVYAHFYDFEIDDDLSLNLQPTSSYSTATGANVGLTLTLNF